MSNDIDDYLSDDFTDEDDLTPPKDDGKKETNHINGKKSDDKLDDDDKYHDDLSYSDDDSLLSQERYENSLKASTEQKSDANGDIKQDRKLANSNDGPRAMSSEEEIRSVMSASYFASFFYLHDVCT